MSFRDAADRPDSDGFRKGPTGTGKDRLRRGGLAVWLVALVVTATACATGTQDAAAVRAEPSASVSASASASAAAPPSASASAGISASPSATPSTSPSASPTKAPVVRATVSDYTGWTLHKAVANARDHHVGSVTYTDASELGRTVAHTSHWKVCGQNLSAGEYSTATKLRLRIVEVGESCAHPPRASSGSGGSSSSGGSGSGGGTSAGSGSSSSGGGSSTTQVCSIRSNAGNCYQAGQFCRKADVGARTTNAAGREITCGFEAGANRWHY
ncbi:hypothetical protein ACFVS9_14620 [Streptomyces sp. NPDC058008]|uniref:hypothetical protein n=1 Tax=Streptomyces sp. NPDC058008 TaxID=3346303 RepID=UPI0036E9FFD6